LQYALIIKRTNVAQLKVGKNDFGQYIIYRKGAKTERSILLTADVCADGHFEHVEKAGY